MVISCCIVTYYGCCVCFVFEYFIFQESFTLRRSPAVSFPWKREWILRKIQTFEDGRMAVEVEPPMEVNNNNKNAEFTKSNDSTSQVEDEKKEIGLSAYERLTRELQNDEKVSKEISAGRRIGFYRIRGDLGSGNFSQVKLGYHCIAKGK